MVKSNNDYSAYNHTCIGYSHLRGERVCQDHSFSEVKRGCCYAALSDGHGGDDYFRSDRGSRFAAEAFASCVEEKGFLNEFFKADGRTRELMIKHFIKSMIVRWNDAVEADIQAFPVNEQELCGVSDRARADYESGRRMSRIYGCTFIGFVLSDRASFGIQIGDGKCTALSGTGELSSPIAWDDECCMNITTSLSDDFAYDKFRFYVSPEGEDTKAVFLCSDGVSDSFDEENFLNFYRVVYDKITSDGATNSVEELSSYLSTLSQKGSGDDMSLCILMKKD